MTNEIRLQKYLADCGIASRRRAEEYIAAGKVAINGQIAQVGAKITPDKDEVVFEGVLVVPKGEEHVYIMLNKPAGVITSASDQYGRKTVLDLIEGVDARLFSIGRLDYATSGLLLLTNDGALTHKLSHPRHGSNKTYIAKVAAPLDEATSQAFADGMEIDGYTTRPAELSIIGADKKTAKIVLYEGRNRQIRKMFEALGIRVVSLKRTAMGSIAIGGLKVGQWRHLTTKEVAQLKKEG
ncbi:MAG: rRNA pseudouridine synthase [Defluviitaleaceae bacterium]|nr:rRNA pseudouridine synthase [Defluviitaleaceae bacterium]